MAAIVKTGTARNLTNEVHGLQLVVSSVEKRFLTYVNDLGGVHTIIVDVEHAAKDAETLLKWFESTRAIISTSSGVEGSPQHVTPEQVIQHANAAVGIDQAPAQDQQSQQQPVNTGGGY